MRYLFIALLLTVIAPNASASCTCGEPLSIETQKNRAFGIFTGTVTDVDYDASFKRYRNHFDVHKSWKGADNETISVFTDRPGVTRLSHVDLGCSYPFLRGETYLVISYRKENLNGPSWTSRCWGTQPLSEAIESQTINRLGTAKHHFSAYPEKITDDMREPAQQNESIKANLLDTTPLPTATPAPDAEQQPYLLPTDKRVPTVLMPYVDRQ